MTEPSRFCTSCGGERISVYARICHLCGAENQPTVTADASTQITETSTPSSAISDFGPSGNPPLRDGSFETGVARPWYKHKRVWILLTVGILIAASLLWLVSSCLAAKGDAEDVVRGFFAAAATGDADLAVGFHHSRADYQVELGTQIRGAAYGEFLRGYEGISFDKSVSYSKSSDGETISISGDIHFSGKPSAPLTVELLKEDGLWKIIGFSAGDP